MKKLLLLMACLLTFASYAEQPREETLCQQKAYVYICTGPQSKRYHCTPNCRGLGSCSEEIKKVTVEKAKSMGRTPCKWCYD